uniref:Protein Tat n=1 Tax=Rabbit endogenous lentivirus type K TaxID=596477 RepID=A0A3Q9T8C3_9RETR|nr:tat protein [Rabbit endogenous lentivirus type K]AZY88394.1 tat protein [Rabbit endogenous lentivirus type K]AZY88399.1 tat protein [Rabbit endogenous lentivirus type K]
MEYQLQLSCQKNSCVCKKCRYHCQLCFLQKELGISYSRARIKELQKWQQQQQTEKCTLKEEKQKTSMNSMHLNE